MAQITISATAAGTLNGNAFSQSASYIATFDELTEQTRDILNTYIEITQNTPGYGFIALFNVGADDAVVEVGCGGVFIQFPLLVGGQLVLPSTLDTAGANNIITSVSARSITATGTRLVVFTGRKLV